MPAGWMTLTLPPTIRGVDLELEREGVLVMDACGRCLGDPIAVALGHALELARHSAGGRIVLELDDPDAG